MNKLNKALVDFWFGDASPTKLTQIGSYFLYGTGGMTNHDLARSFFEVAEKYNPNITNEDLHLCLGLFLLKENKKTEALEHIMKARDHVFFKKRPDILLDFAGYAYGISKYNSAYDLCETFRLILKEENALSPKTGKDLVEYQALLTYERNIRLASLYYLNSPTYPDLFIGLINLEPSISTENVKLFIQYIKRNRGILPNVLTVLIQIYKLEDNIVDENSKKEIAKLLSDYYLSVSDPSQALAWARLCDKDTTKACKRSIHSVGWKKKAFDLSVIRDHFFVAFLSINIFIVYIWISQWWRNFNRAHASLNGFSVFVFACLLFFYLRYFFCVEKEKLLFLTRSIAVVSCFLVLTLILNKVSGSYSLRTGICILAYLVEYIIVYRMRDQMYDLYNDTIHFIKNAVNSIRNRP